MDLLVTKEMVDRKENLESLVSLVLKERKEKEATMAKMGYLVKRACQDHQVPE